MFSNKIKICFLCLGNICRSPMAEFILKSKLKKNNIKNVIVESRGTSYEEQGNPIYPKAQEVLFKNNIETAPHRATCIEKSDLKKFNHFICMEDHHVNIARTVLGPKANIYKLQRYDIEDPWYSGEFDKVFEEISEGCDKIIERIKKGEM